MHSKLLNDKYDRNNSKEKTSGLIQVLVRLINKIFLFVHKLYFSVFGIQNNFFILKYSCSFLFILTIAFDHILKVIYLILCSYFGVFPVFVCNSNFLFPCLRIFNTIFGMFCLSYSFNDITIFHICVSYLIRVRHRMLSKIPRMYSRNWKIQKKNIFYALFIACEVIETFNRQVMHLLILVIVFR